jgi:hypothetical protein
VIVLVGRPVRDRRPAATEWRLIEYDRATRLPLGDRGFRWEPAGPSGQSCRVGGRVLDWAGRLLGHPVSVGRPADDLAGPGSWHLDPADPADPASPAGWLG